jgi:hypothetical protein
LLHLLAHTQETLLQLAVVKREMKAVLLLELLEVLVVVELVKIIRVVSVVMAHQVKEMLVVQAYTLQVLGAAGVLELLA